MKLQKLLAALALCLSLCMGGSTVNGQDIQKLWPTTGLYSDDQLRQFFYNVSFKPLGRKELAFKMLVSKDWNEIPITVPRELLKQEDRIPLPLAEVRAPDWSKSYAAVYVHSVKLTKKVGLEEWVSAYLEGNKISPLSRRKGTFNDRKVQDVLYRSNQENGSFLVRQTFSCHGSYIFFVTCAALDSSFQKYAKIFSIAAISFEPQVAKCGDQESRDSIKAAKLVNRTLKIFAQCVKSGDFTNLRNVCSSSFKKKATPKAFAEAFNSFVEKKIDFSSIKGLNPVFEEKPVMDLSKPLRLKGKYYGNVMTVNFDFTYEWENSEWKLANIGIRTGAPEVPPGTKLTVPDRKSLINLANGTILNLGECINKNDFTEFYRNIATTWKAQTTKNDFAEMFSSFVDHQIDLTTVKGAEPTFEEQPYIEGGKLVLKGHYRTAEMTVNFELKYWKENEEWRLISIHVYTQ